MVDGNIITNFLNYWQEVIGLDQLLAFLLVFALILGILTKIDLFKGNRAVNVIIALVVGITALQWGFLTAFMSELFPRFAIALVVVLVFAIIMLAFAPEGTNGHADGIKTGLYIAGGVFALIAVVGAFNDPKINWFNSGWWVDNGGMLVGALIVVGLIIAISMVGSKTNSTPARHP